MDKRRRYGVISGDLTSRIARGEEVGEVPELYAVLPREVERPRGRLLRGVVDQDRAVRLAQKMEARGKAGEITDEEALELKQAEALRLSRIIDILRNDEEITCVAIIRGEQAITLTVRYDAQVEKKFRKEEKLRIASDGESLSVNFPIKHLTVEAVKKLLKYKRVEYYATDFGDLED